MRYLTILLTIIFTLQINATETDKVLQIEQDGFTVIVVNFEEGDKIKLFEAETGEHILSKTRGQIDLSQLPKGTYLLENNAGESIVIEKSEVELVVEEPLNNDYIVSNESSFVNMEKESLEEQIEDIYYESERNPLHIEQEGNFITVLDFEEGDTVKLFEVKNTVHILSKTTYEIDLSQLPAGRYILESTNGKSIIVEKFDDEAEYADTF